MGKNTRYKSLKLESLNCTTGIRKVTQDPKRFILYEDFTIGCSLDGIKQEKPDYDTSIKYAMQVIISIKTKLDTFGKKIVQQIEANKLKECKLHTHSITSDCCKSLATTP